MSLCRLNKWSKLSIDFLCVISGIPKIVIFDIIILSLYIHSYVICTMIWSTEIFSDVIFYQYGGNTYITNTQVSYGLKQIKTYPIWLKSAVLIWTADFIHIWF